MSTDDQTSIESILHEDRVFEPDSDFSQNAHIKSFADFEKLYKQAADDPVAYWEDIARNLHWFKHWDKALEWEEPFSKWFIGGTTNVSYNCIDRHLDGPRKDKIAILWEGEPEDEVRRITYQELYYEVCRIANALKGLGIEKGDRVAIYMPMVPEAVYAMQACARIGATHTVIFGGFSADAIRDRVNDCGCKAVITADGGFRRGKVLKLKETVDAAVEGCPTVESVVVLRRVSNEIEMREGRDYWWHEITEAASAECTAEELDSEHPLFILYTSGTTGKPKGIMHTTGGYLTGAYITSKWVFDLKDEDIFWCTADVGWITGHTYVAYGPLANGATVLMYEGAPNHPDFDRFWQIIDKHKVTILYTAPTAIRAFVKWGDEYPNRHDLSSLRLLGTVGEPINPEAWMWYHNVIGRGRCPIVDTWWQTETGGIMISPLPGATPTVPGTATRPLPGILVDIQDKEGNSAATDEGGYLVITHPFPSMLRTIWGDDERYKKQYWSDIPNVYFAGDGARRDKRGYYWIMGRVDDVINVSGHRLGTAEIESALVSHEAVAEAAVVGRPHEIKGQAIAAFVTLEGHHEASEEMKGALIKHVAKEIGSLAKPDDLTFTDALPKTRSGKIMRRLLRELASTGEVTGDVTTLEDFTVLEKLRGKDGGEA
ncbi:MAG: acetate--CoA ligase [Pyrinomonadaceae bacterium]|nr:acetate--CoA ligase [Pyrinomonadaceae bacterium]